MRHRLYYLLPDIDSAHRTRDDLLLQRIEHRCIHFISSTSLPQDLPEGTIFHKTDIVRGAEAGTLVGALLGMGLGALIVLYFDMTSEALVVTAATIVGALFGGWVSSMVAAGIPNSRLKNFFPEIEKGRVLMIVDVPARRVAAIEALLAERHPELNFRGEEATIPVFP